ncbi:MAG: tetratricopeptide repeat protein [Gammaproteobacteria bacterium]|jgi:tetratricopeptide (TPR) repeat protein|nr:tetratricopeptide repeat protein [Gammaproteobacteria bacterium]
MTRLKLFVFFILLILSSQSVMADDRDVFNRALNLSKQGQWQQAADLYAQLASRNPQWPEPKNNLAVSLINLGKITEAQQALDAAVVSRNSFSVAQTNRQRLYDYLAAQAYSKALSQKSVVPPPTLDLISTLDLPAAIPAVQTPPVVVAPAVITPPAANHKVVSPDTVITVEAFVNNWAQAWSTGSVKNYLMAYSQRFRPDEGKSFEQWADSRRLRLQTASNTKVDVQDLHVYIDISQQQAVAEFIQSYTSSTYSDRTVKQLVLTLEGTGWRILAERVIAQR